MHVTQLRRRADSDRVLLSVIFGMTAIRGHVVRISIRDSRVGADIRGAPFLRSLLIHRTEPLLVKPST